MTSDKLNLIKEKGAAEAKRFLWIAAYLWIILGLFSLHKSIVLNEPHPFYHQGFAIINALVLAKIMLIAEVFNLADDMKHKPLIYPIVYKSAVFSVLLITFHFLEEILSAIWRGQSVEQTMTSGGNSLTGLLVFGVIMFVVLMPFFALREVARDVGKEKLFEQFFLQRRQYVPLKS